MGHAHKQLWVVISDLLMLIIIVTASVGVAVFILGLSEIAIVGLSGILLQAVTRRIPTIHNHGTIRGFDSHKIIW
jgi:hypothetical protein